MGFHAKMVAHLLERDLDLPALDEPAQDLNRVAGLVGAKQGLRIEPVQRVAHEPLRSHSTRCARGTFGCSAHRIGTMGIPP